jgi:predicted kinase
MNSMMPAEFVGFYEKFRMSDLWQNMQNTVENSPWHREENVAVHTQMIVDHYLREFAPLRTTKERVMTLLAILFHDTGKPDAEEVKESAERGTYRTYAGHEKISSRTFIDFAMTHADWFASLGMDTQDISNVAFMIEHHLPYGLKNVDKRTALKTALAYRLESIDMFYDLLRSDAAGRISDGHAEKLANVENWITEFEQVQVKPGVTRETPLIAYILVGPSGSGKSTFIKPLRNPVVFSLDDCRLDFYDRITDDPKQAYAEAWDFANANKSAFDKYVDERWNAAKFEAARSHRPLVIDNTNLTRKARARWASELMTSKAHHFGSGENGWNVIGVTFYTSLRTLLQRRMSRGDKKVPLDTVIDMYNRVEEFLPGTECHALIFKQS